VESGEIHLCSVCFDKFLITKEKYKIDRRISILYLCIYFLEKQSTVTMITISVVVMIALISNTNGIYAQENKITIMNKSYKYFAIQDIKSSVPDNFAPEH
jgi:hypothetical protein